MCHNRFIINKQTEEADDEDGGVHVYVGCTFEKFRCIGPDASPLIVSVCRFSNLYFLTENRVAGINALCISL